MTTARAELPTIRIRGGPEAVAVLRATARVVLTAGVLVAGFVVYSLGVTNLFATRAQANLQADLAARIAGTTLIETEFTAGAGSQSPVVVPELPPLDPAEAAGFDPQVFEVPAASLEAPFLVSEPLPLRGEAMGRIVVPAAGVDWTVVEGVGRDDLKTGAGHMPETALPGQPGNAVISGHRTTYGAPFLHLDRVEVGSLVLVETASGTHVYRVADSFVVDPGATWVTEQWEGAWLTLTTCEPVLSSAKRLVVVATLVAGPNAGVILRAQ